MTIRCLIVEDEHLAQELLKQYIIQSPELELIGVCDDGLQALHFLRDHEVDLIFLDIQMPNLSGMELARSLQRNTSKTPQLVFTTAYSEFAVDGFQVNALDYLLKPVTFERFLQTIEKVRSKFLENKTSPTQLLKTNSSESNKENFIFVKSGTKMVKVILSEILFIEGLREYVKFQVKDQQILSLQSLKSLEEQLPQNEFLRVHKSYIIPINQVNAYSSHQVEIKEHIIPIGKTYREKVSSIFRMI